MIMSFNVEYLVYNSVFSFEIIEYLVNIHIRNLIALLGL